MFSLFHNDPLNRLFTVCHLREGRNTKYITVIGIFILVTWCPLAVLSLLEDIAYGNADGKINFFRDYAAYAQFLIGIPLFFIAEEIIDRTKDPAVRHFRSSGLVPSSDLNYLNEKINNISKTVQSIIPDIYIILLAYIITGLLFGSMWWTEKSSNIATWHALLLGDIKTITWTGLWAGIVSIPIFLYLLFRWVWKTFLWCYLLWCTSKIKLQIVASHPDGAGGLAFLSRIQAHYGILIFSVGLIIAATAIYKIDIEKANIDSFGVIGPILGFIILAPTAFIIPLLLFSKQLITTKRITMFQFSEFGRKFHTKFHNKWIKGENNEEDILLASTDISGMADFNAGYDTLRQMRVIPYDFVSLLHLIFATLTPLAPFLIKVIPWPEKIKCFFNNLL